MKFHVRTIRREHRGRQYEFSAQVTDGVTLDLEFIDVEQARSWMRRLLRMPARVVTHARPVIRSVAGGLIDQPHLRVRQVL